MHIILSAERFSHPNSCISNVLDLPTVAGELKRKYGNQQISTNLQPYMAKILIRLGGQSYFPNRRRRDGTPHVSFDAIIGSLPTYATLIANLVSLSVLKLND